MERAAAGNSWHPCGSPVRTALLIATMTSIGCNAPRDDADAAALDAPPSTDAPSARAVRVATFNVRKLFDTACDSGMCGSDGFEETASRAQIDARVARVAQAIASFDADVICLAEVETEALFMDLQRALGPAYVGRVFGETDDPGSLDVGVLARLRVLDARRHSDEILRRPDGTTTRFTRELLEVHLDTGGGARFIAVAAHFKSRANDDPDRRLAEAQATARILLEIVAAWPGVPVTLGGDLNDEPGSAPLTALDDAGHARVADLPAASAFTLTFGGRPVWIDHIYTAAGSPARYVPGSGRTVRDGASGLAGSDHAALVADLTF